MDLAFLFLLILAGLFAWQALDTFFSGDFVLAAFMSWLMASGLAWWWTREEPLLLRVPVGFLSYLGLAAFLMPLSWWSGSKPAVVTEAVVAAVLSRYVGAWLSRLLQPKLISEHWYLDQRINLVDDLFRWAFVSGIAWFVAGLLPLLLVFLLPLEWISEVALIWAFAVLVWYLHKQRPSRARFAKVPLGIWVFIASETVLRVFQAQLIGPLEAGSIGEIAYVAYAPVVAALFAEIVVLGTLKPSRMPAAP